jgi:hypothetical protein
MEVFQDPVAEAGADMSDVAPCFVFPHGEDQGAEERPGAPRRREPGDYYFLSLCRLDLQPIGGPASGRVRAVGALRQEAFQTLSLGLGEEFLTVPLAVRAEGDEFVARQNRLQPLLALEERLFA